MIDFIAPLTIGFFGSLHCLGMCGPLVVAYSIKVTPPRTDASPEVLLSARQLWGKRLLHHGAFHFGRLLCYGLLGAAAAGLFRAAELSRLFFHIRVDVHLVSGMLLMVLGALLMRVVPVPAFFGSSSSAAAAFLGKPIQRLLTSRSLVSKAALGFSIGFLPCCLSWAMILTAASTMHFAKGFQTMIAFGLGTLPALYLTGLMSTMLTVRIRSMGERFAGLSVMVMGILLMLRGFGIIS